MNGKQEINLSDSIKNFKPQIDVKGATTPKNISATPSENPFAGKKIENTINDTKIVSQEKVKETITAPTPQTSVMKKPFVMPKISFSMPKFSFGQGNFFRFSGKLSWTEAIIPTVLILILTILVIINNDLGNMLIQGNNDNTMVYNNINASIPKDEIETLIKEKKNMDIYDNIKTSLTVYEIWNFLSRIIPKTNSSETIDIKEAKISITYTDSEFVNHLALENTLDVLKRVGLIKSYKSEPITGTTGDDLTTYYTTTINLDAGIDKDVGVRKVTTKSGSGTNTDFKYRAILETDRGSSTEKSTINIREFLEKYSKDNDPSVSEFLQFKN